MAADNPGSCISMPESYAKAGLPYTKTVSLANELFLARMAPGASAVWLARIGPRPAGFAFTEPPDPPPPPDGG